jgi:hypothetical protein
MKHGHDAASAAVQVVTLEVLEHLDIRYPIRPRGADLGVKDANGFRGKIEPAKAGESEQALIAPSAHELFTYELQQLTFWGADHVKSLN